MPVRQKFEGLLQKVQSLLNRGASILRGVNSPPVARLRSKLRYSHVLWR